MPLPKRRRTAGPGLTARPSHQSTLSFRSTKATAADPEKKSAKLQKSAKIGPNEEEQKQNGTLQDSQLSVASLGALPEPIDQVPQLAKEHVGDEEENQEQRKLEQSAAALSEAKILEYWETKERQRKAPRLHQQDLKVREKILREFDMNSRFGPGVGISRLVRWHRAQDLGLSPPIEVLAVLLKEGDGRKGASHLRDADKSILDELIMSSKVKGDAISEA